MYHYVEFFEIWKNFNLFFLIICLATVLGCVGMLLFLGNRVVYHQKKKMIAATILSIVVLVPAFYYEAKNDVKEWLLDCYSNNGYDNEGHKRFRSDQAIEKAYKKLTGENIPAKEFPYL